MLPRCPLSPLTEADSDHGLLAGHLPMRQVLFSSGSAGGAGPYAVGETSRRGKSRWRRGGMRKF